MIFSFFRAVTCLSTYLAVSRHRPLLLSIPSALSQGLASALTCENGDILNFRLDRLLILIELCLIDSSVRTSFGLLRAFPIELLVGPRSTLADELSWLSSWYVGHVQCLNYGAAWLVSSWEKSVEIVVVCWYSTGWLPSTFGWTARIAISLIAAQAVLS